MYVEPLWALCSHESSQLPWSYSVQSKRRFPKLPGSALSPAPCEVPGHVAVIQSRFHAVPGSLSLLHGSGAHLRRVRPCPQRLCPPPLARAQLPLTPESACGQPCPGPLTLLPWCVWPSSVDCGRGSRGESHMACGLGSSFLDPAKCLLGSSTRFCRRVVFRRVDRLSVRPSTCGSAGFWLLLAVKDAALSICGWSLGSHGDCLGLSRLYGESVFNFIRNRPTAILPDDGRGFQGLCRRVAWSGWSSGCSRKGHVAVAPPRFTLHFLSDK